MPCNSPCRCSRLPEPCCYSANAPPQDMVRRPRCPISSRVFRIFGGLALIGAVVAEYVAGTGGGDVGLATRIMEAGRRLEIARVFAGLVLLSVTGIVIYLALDFLSRLLLRHWHESADAGPD